MTKDNSHSIMNLIASFSSVIKPGITSLVGTLDNFPIVPKWKREDPNYRQTVECNNGVCF